MRRLGEVPDFDALHSDWERRLTRARAHTRKRLTLPEVRSRPRRAHARHSRIALEAHAGSSGHPCWNRCVGLLAKRVFARLRQAFDLGAGVRAAVSFQMVLRCAHMERLRHDFTFELIYGTLL